MLLVTLQDEERQVSDNPIDMNQGEVFASVVALTAVPVLVVLIPTIIYEWVYFLKWKLLGLVKAVINQFCKKNILLVKLGIMYIFLES